MAAAAPNLEEASNVATEFIYGIDNLPGEVSHILQEIKYRDVRTAELQNEIDREAARYIRHSRRASSASTPMPLSSASNPSGSTPATPIPDSPSSSFSRGDSSVPNGASIPIPLKIQASYTEIHELAAEKCLLAQRLIDVITRARAKLDADIARVRLLQGEPPELVAAQASASLHMKPAGMINLPSLNSSNSVGAISTAESFGAPGRNPALAISESLRNALGQPAERTSVSAASSPAPLTGHAIKKRRTTTTTSIKISPAASPTKHRSASPASVVPAAHTQTKSRLSRQVHPPPTQEEEDDHDLDGEGEDDDGDGEDDNEDETLYCFCQKQSYGDMIACDNEGACPYEWFHLACVGLKQPPAEKWFCSVCAKTKGLTSGTTTTSRKGRKK